LGEELTVTPRGSIYRDQPYLLSAYLLAR